MARYVRAGMVAIDIGANFGYYTILLGALVGDSGRVFAIEPAPKAAALLRRSVELNGFQSYTTIIEVAAGASEGTQPFYVPDREPKNAQIVASSEGADTSAGTLHQVAQSRVDVLIGGGSRVDFVKIDAEGAEEAVVAGMLATLRRERPQLVLEFNAKRAREPDRLLGTLCEIYGGPRYLDLQGNVHDTTVPRLLSERFGIDWLLVFGGR
jgi:FkbM family methyltransferase